MKIAKRLICLLVILLLNITPVSASDEPNNKLSFSSSGDRIYYNSKLFDENKFMSHLNMLPGDEFEDILLIENKTDSMYSLYFKILEPKQNVNQLLDNINMTITLEDHVVYEGPASGHNPEYSESNESNELLEGYIYMGRYFKGTERTLKIESSLNEFYDNKNAVDLSEIEWEFLAVYDGELNTIFPNAGGHGTIIYTVGGIALMGLSVLIIRKRK